MVSGIQENEVCITPDIRLFLVRDFLYFLYLQQGLSNLIEHINSPFPFLGLWFCRDVSERVIGLFAVNKLVIHGNRALLEVYIIPPY